MLAICIESWVSSLRITSIVLIESLPASRALPKCRNWPKTNQLLSLVSTCTLHAMCYSAEHMLAGRVMSPVYIYICQPRIHKTQNTHTIRVRF